MNVNFINYRQIYTYSYGNVSGYDIRKARGVEEFYALLRSSIYAIQWAQDNTQLETILNDQRVIDAGSIGLK